MLGTSVQAQTGQVYHTPLSSQALKGKINLSFISMTLGKQVPTQANKKKEQSLSVAGMEYTKIYIFLTWNH